jgi:hypothetical protein
MDQRSLEILSKIALTFTQTDNIDTQMNTILRKIGEYTNVSGIYIFLDSKDGSATSNVYEWCEGIEPQIELLQDMPYEIIPSWKKFLHEDGRVYSENISDLPDDARAILEPKNIILEREHIQLPLRAEKENFETFFNTIDDMIIIGDIEGKLITNAANPPFFIFGSRGVKTVSKMSRMITGSLPLYWKK